MTTESQIVTGLSQTLPGFDNILAVQEGTKLHLAVEGDDGVLDSTLMTVIDSADYDSEQEFMMECVLWARRNGGREIPQ